MDLARVVWQGNYLDDLWPFWIAFVAAAVSAMPIYNWLIAMKSRQTVSQYAPEGHQLKQGTPTMGGLIVVYAFLFAWSVVIWRAPRMVPNTFDIADVAVPLLFAGFAVIGFVDDYLVPKMIPGKRGLGWRQKFILQFIVALLFGLAMCRDSIPVCASTIFLILFFSNAYNFSDGLDGLASVLLIGIVGGLIGIEVELGMGIRNGALLAVVGAILPFLYLNKPKAKLFMGDVGSLPIGALLGASVAFMLFAPYFSLSTYWRHSIESHPPEYKLLLAPLPVCLALLIVSGMMFVELVPVPLQILSVKLRKKKLFSFTPIHHAFEKKGWPEVKVMLMFALCQVLLSAIAIGLVFIEVVQKRPTGSHL